MSKEYYYVVRYSDYRGWTINPDTESANFPNGTIYDTILEEWQFGYLGDGEYNGKECELTETLNNILDLHNSTERVNENT